MPDMGRGIIAPANNDNIGTGASEMRTLASTAATAIDALAAQKADQSTVDGLAADLTTKASIEYVDAGIEGALWDRTAQSLTTGDNIDDLDASIYYVSSGATASALGIPTNQHGWLTIYVGNTGVTKRAEYRTIAWAGGDTRIFRNATTSTGEWREWSEDLSAASLDEVRWDRTAPSLTTSDNVDDLAPAVYYVPSGNVATALGLPTRQHGWLTVLRGAGGATRRAEYRTIAGSDGRASVYRSATNSTGVWGPWVEDSDAVIALEGVVSALSGDVTDLSDEVTSLDQSTTDRLDGIATAYDVWLSQGNTGTVDDYFQAIKGDRGEEGPYGGTEVTDPQVASWVSDESSDTSEALEARLVAQVRPVPTDEVVTATPVQHPLPAATPHDAFPGLTRTGDGSYLASWRGGEGHNSSDGMVYLSRSWDGRAWSVPVAVPSDVHPDGDARDVSIAQLGAFTVLSYYSAGANLSYIRKSTDNGETWGPSIYLPFDSGGIEFISAPAVQVGDAWLVTAYGNSAVRVLRSTDQGETWSAPIVVARGGVQEPNLIPLDGEQVRIVWRTNYDGIAKTALSTDGGLTWGPASDAYWGQGNPHLVRLRSGAVVSTYKSSAGHSTNKYSYACARISFDGGATWGPETVFGYASRKMAYAQAVETDIDGEMLCVWSAETSNTAARLYSVRLTHGGAITRDGGAPSPVTPRPGIARQHLSLQKSSDQVISPNTWTAVEWEDQRADHWEGFNPSRSLTDFKVDETGLYVITFRAAWNASTPFTLAIKPTAGARQILHDSWDGVDGAVFKDGTLSGVVELEEGVAYQAQARHGTEGSSRRLLSGDYAYRTRLTVAKIKGF